MRSYGRQKRASGHGSAGGKNFHMRPQCRESAAGKTKNPYAAKMWAKVDVVKT